MGFGRGRFRGWKKDADGTFPEAQAATEREFEFQVVDANMFCILDNQFITYGDFFEAKRKVTPDKAILCYHTAKHDLISGWTIFQDYTCVLFFFLELFSGRV